MKTYKRNCPICSNEIVYVDKYIYAGLKLILNYQVRDDLNLFYVDGYDPIHSIVMEYDTKYHLNPKQLEKDLIRQNKIIDILKPKKFLRYNAVNKTWKNVAERMK